MQYRFPIKLHFIGNWILGWKKPLQALLGDASYNLSPSFFHLFWPRSLRPSLAPTCSSRRWRIKFFFLCVSLCLTPPKFHGFIISPLTLILVVSILWCSCRISLVVIAKASITVSDLNKPLNPSIKLWCSICTEMNNTSNHGFVEEKRRRISMHKEHFSNWTLKYFS